VPEGFLVTLLLETIGVAVGEACEMVIDTGVFVDVEVVVPAIMILVVIRAMPIRLTFRLK
jgi:hypothetical protein